MTGREYDSHPGILDLYWTFNRDQNGEYQPQYGGTAVFTGATVTSTGVNAPPYPYIVMSLEAYESQCVMNLNAPEGGCSDSIIGSHSGAGTWAGTSSDTLWLEFTRTSYTYAPNSSGVWTYTGYYSMTYAPVTFDYIAGTFLSYGTSSISLEFHDPSVEFETSKI